MVVNSGGPLGRREPTDWRHVEKFPLSALAGPDRPVETPSPVGVNWYVEFDHPVQSNKDRRWRVAQSGKLTRVRGGHCVCVLPPFVTDTTRWWRFYNQGHEGACVGFGCSRAMSLLNRKSYDARWLYHAAQEIDEWADTPPEEGTSVRAGLEILRTSGHRIMRNGFPHPPNPREGISVYRWATNIDDWLAAIGRPGASEVPFLNSWGQQGYPHITWMPTEVWAQLLRQDGEFSIITDR